MESTNLQLPFEEPPVLLGHIRVGGELQRFYLPLATALGHTLVISRSGGGKSHTLATLAFGLAKTAAVRRLNLLARQAAYPHKTAQPPTTAPVPATAPSLLEVVPDYAPVSLCVFDPHRDLARRLLDDFTRQIGWVRAQRKRGAGKPGLPSQRRNEGDVKIQPRTTKIPNWEDLLEEMITYIDLGDRENVFGLNLLDTAMWESKENCASTLIDIFKRIYPDAWGSRMEDVFRHSVFALYLLNTQRRREAQFTLLDIVPFITLDVWREALLDHPIISDDNPTIAAWWKIQFTTKMNDNFRNEVIKPVLNKLNPFLGSDILSRIFGQSQTTLDFSPLIANGSIMLIDLAASEIETENCALAGAILIGFLLKKARHLADPIKREADRPQVQLIVDEFNVILAAPYADIMGQYRKWGVRATLATQSLTLLDELDPTLRPLVMANAANLLVLQVNAEDAEYLRRELVADGTASSRSGGLAGFAGSLISPAAGGGGLGPDLYDLVNAGRGLGYFKGTFDNVREPVFSLQIAPRPFEKFSRVDRAGLSSSQPQSSRNPYTGGMVGTQIQNEVEREKAFSMAAILTRCQQNYTSPAFEISRQLNEKQRDYLRLYALDVPDPAASELLTGFRVWQTELAAVLERHIGQARNDFEGAKTRKTYYDRKRDKGKAKANDKATEQDNLEEDSNNKEEKPTPNANPDRAVQTHSPIPPFAPGHAIPPPVRKVVSIQQRFRETRQLPDGQDYRPAAQARTEHKKQRAKQKRQDKRLREAEAARNLGQQYARQQFEPGLSTAKVAAKD